MSHLPIWRFLVLFSTHKYEFGAEIWRRWSSSRLTATVQRNYKIVNFMWCGSPQNALRSAYILCHIKYYFQVFLGE